MPDDPGSNFLFVAKQFSRDLGLYLDSPATFRMTAADIFSAAGIFEPDQIKALRPVPTKLVRDRATAVFNARFGHRRPDLEREQADAEAARQEAASERKALEQEIAALPEWVKPVPPSAAETQEPMAGSAVPSSWGQKLFAMLLLGVILGLATYAWINTANLSVDVFQSWPRALLSTVPIWFGPWFGELLFAYVTRHWPSVRVGLMVALAFLGLFAFGLFLYGYYRNVLANDAIAGIFSRFDLPVSPIGVQILSQILFEVSFGVLLVEKFLSIVRRWARRNPRRQELQRQLLTVAARFNAAAARFKQVANSLACIEVERKMFVDLVERFVRLKWQLRYDESANRSGLSKMLDGLAHDFNGASPKWIDFLNLLRGRKGDLR